MLMYCGAVREIINSGEIGDVKAVQVSFGFFNPGTVERLLNPDLGAGAILGTRAILYSNKAI
jgi:predicted dehydrogenase